MKKLSVCLACGLLAASAWCGVDPASLEFARLASRRFVLDNELPFCTWAPKTAVAPTVQYPPMTNVLDAAGKPFVVVGAYNPVAHYRIRVTGPNAEMAFAKKDGTVILRVPAKGKNLPKAPYDFSVILGGNSRPATFVTKDGKTRLVEFLNWPERFAPRDKANLQKVKFCVGGSVGKAEGMLTSGIGQADVRFVTTGRQNRLYMENGRVFFTFSARGGISHSQGVASFDPTLFDVRLEGTILFDMGDGELRNDIASHIFYDDKDGFWKGWTSNFSTASDKLTGRREGGLNAVWSEKCPLHGLSVMHSKSLGMKGMNEDPCGTWDEESKRWTLLVSEFTPKGIRASMWQSREWDGPYVNTVRPVERDSTGTTITWIGGIRYCFSGSADRACYVYSYPDLLMRGKLHFDYPPWNDDTCRGGRVWPCIAELPKGYPYRYILLTMNRANFPGMPKPNWTYGGLCYYGAN